FYANEKKINQARNTNRVLRAIGLRTAIQEATGWNKPKREYGNLLLSAPRVWTKVFGDEFYDELSRLTGLSWDKKTHQKPCVFAQLTYDLVYSHLPHSVYKQIKSTQKEHGGYIHKMHQFLNEQGLNSLVHHLDLTLNILSAVSSLDQAKLLVTQAVTRTYQQSLFG
ncbi:MAG TPA: P63C domain-containing protein, partial [Methanosarcina sp.]|nr:P63C domain-containing protein [Methanosarcina sp.]